MKLMNFKYLLSNVNIAGVAVIDHLIVLSDKSHRLLEMFERTLKSLGCRTTLGIIKDKDDNLYYLSMEF